MTLAAEQSLEVPRPHRFTREEYYQMADAGMFLGQRVELIEGEIIDMAPQKNPHVLCVTLVTAALTKAFGEKFWIRSQAPLHLIENSEPEPDLAVVAGPMKSYKDHPTTALLVVEVSDTTLRYDRGPKASIYARAGITDYWIINLVDNCVEILRQPTKQSGATASWRYESIVKLKTGDHASPLAKPDSQIAVADLLP